MSEESTRYYGVYRALVVDTRDPMQNGRVRIRVPSVTGDTDSGWAFVAASTPEEGDTVVVAFEEGELESPIVIGVLWRDQADPVPAS